MHFARIILAAAAVALLGVHATYAGDLAPSAAPRPPAQSPSAKPAKAAHPRTPAVTSTTPIKVMTVEGITEYRLANGLKVLLFPDRSKPTVTVNMTYLVGSRHENYGETGMAHLLEHLLFKGTPTFPAIDQEFNKRGMRSNGSTTRDRTNYYELFQASDDNLKWAIDMEADRMVHSFVAKKDLDSEMTVVRNEYESGENSPFGVFIKRLESVAYDWHNYGKSTIGNRSDIENVKIENLQAFYRQYYQPDNAVLLVAGKFDEARVLDWVAAAFNKIPKPARTLPVLWTVESQQDGERSFYVRRKGDIQVVGVAYKVPSGRHADIHGVAFSNDILMATPNGRLYKALVESGKAVQVAGLPMVGLDSSLHLFVAVVKKGEPLEPARDEIIKTVETFFQNPPTAEEMERVRVNNAKIADQVLNNHESIGVAMSEFIALGDWRLFFQGRDATQAATTEQVSATARAYYRRDNRIVGYFVPEDAPQRVDLPSVPSVSDALKDFKPKQTTSEAETFDPANAVVDKRTKRIEIGGIKLALLAKKNRGETVNVVMRFHTGDEKSLFDKGEIRDMTGYMLSRGTSKFTRARLVDEWNKLKVSGGVSGLDGSLLTNKSNVAAAIRLAAHVMREPVFPESEFAQLKKQIITGIESQKSDPGALAGQEMDRHFNIYPKGDVRYAGTIDEELAAYQAVKLDDIKGFYKAFYGANRGEIAIVGDFDESDVVKAITEAFDGFKTSAPYKRLDGEFKDVAPANKLIETPDKENGVFRARMNIELNVDDADYPALYLANYIFGGGAGLNSRLSDRIRQKEGLSYGVGSSLHLSTLDRDGSWLVEGIAAPQNMLKVESAFLDELAKAIAKGFTVDEVKSAKSGALQQRLQSRAQDGALAAGWVGNLFYGRTFARSQDFEDKLAALSPEQVSAAFRKYIIPAKLTIIKAGDFAKVGKAPPAR
jgi:zinc protease